MGIRCAGGYRKMKVEEVKFSLGVIEVKNSRLLLLR